MTVPFSARSHVFSGFRSFLINVFENMHEKKGGSIIIISHQERILNIADKLVVIAGGELSKIGTKDEILPELLGKAGSVACPTLSEKVV